MAVRDVETWNLNDFSSVVQYNTPHLWTSPDPSKERDVYKGYGYSDGTFHETTTPGESFSLRFQGKSVTLHGATGPNYGAFTVDVDGNKASYSAAANQRTNSTQLFSVDGLAAGPWHTISVTNGDASFLLDYLEVVADVSMPGTDSQTSIVEEDHATYSGHWTKNTNPAFSSGGGIYCNETGASATLNFEGSVIALAGDTNSDHGPYTIQLDNDAPVTLRSATGCGLEWTAGAKCEMVDPNIMWLQSYLGPGTHTIKITNANNSFIHIDRFIVLKPAQYITTSAPSSTTTVSGTGGSTTVVAGPTTTGGTTSTPPPDAAVGRYVVSSFYLPFMFWKLFF